MKKCGFTLIETIVSMLILSILLNIGISLSKLNNSIGNDIQNSQYIYEIQNLLSYGKAVCREKNEYGKITIKASKNELRFVEGWDNIEKIINLPKEMKIISGDLSVLITPKGKISKGTTIKITGKYGERKDITIGVGIDLINIS